MKRCHWVKPVLVCQIKFTAWTRDDRRRQPVFLGIREDKNAREVKQEKAS
jgi:bifunctional non-homologous end joining protein LigD